MYIVAVLVQSLKRKKTPDIRCTVLHASSGRIRGRHTKTRAGRVGLPAKTPPAMGEENSVEGRAIIVICKEDVRGQHHVPL